MHNNYAHIGELHFKVMEEVGEMLQAYGKMGRFGPMSRHPKAPEGLTNAEQVILECEDVISRVRELKTHAYQLINEHNANTMSSNMNKDIQDDVGSKLLGGFFNEYCGCNKDTTDIKLVTALVDELDD